MSDHGPSGFDPENLDRLAKEVGDGLRDALGKFGGLLGDVGFDFGTAWSSHSGDRTARRGWPSPRPTTTGDVGDGVWAIYTVTADGAARVDEVYATELDALRANKNNTDPRRQVRFLPYGVTVSVLDEDRDTGNQGSGNQGSGNRSDSPDAEPT